MLLPIFVTLGILHGFDLIVLTSVLYILIVMIIGPLLYIFAINKEISIKNYFFGELENIKR